MSEAIDKMPSLADKEKSIYHLALNLLVVIDLMKVRRVVERKFPASGYLRARLLSFCRKIIFN